MAENSRERLKMGEKTPEKTHTIYDGNRTFGSRGRVAMLKSCYFCVEYRSKNERKSSFLTVFIAKTSLKLTKSHDLSGEGPENAANLR